MAQQHPIQVNKQALKDAQNLWSAYTELTKKAVIFIVILLGILAVVFV